jgi:halimadienyl-diphosphate synthase
MGEIDWELSSQALEWLCENQLPDGSWGAEKPFYYHDRVISTLSAMIALTHRGRRNMDRVQIEKGLLALEKITGGATKGLHGDFNGPTVGFEMVVPTLVEEAEKLGIINHQGKSILGRLRKQRTKKLELLKGKKINRNLTAAFSAEMAGIDGQHMLEIENLQEKNGSIGHSPSATAYYSIFIKPGDKTALEYLHKYLTPSNGAPDLLPFETFETNWVLWNLALVDGKWHQNLGADFQRALDILKNAWQKGKGIGLSNDYSVPDGDDTFVAYELLTKFDSISDIEAILAFEESEHFCAYPYEAHSSNSVNIHAMGTLRLAGYSVESPKIKKIIKYLQANRFPAGYWFDKWNLSPYYTTTHAIIVCAGFADQLVNKSVEWIVQTQKKDGSWGYQFSTAEETAYCIQALVIWQEHGGKIPPTVIKNAVTWLKDHAEPPFPPIWMGKGLYTPELIVRSTILSALALANGGF